MQFPGRHIRWLNYCLKQVNKRDIKEYRHIAVLIRNNRIINIGINKYKSGMSKSNLYFLKGIHAELDLLCKVDPEQLKHSIIYTIGITPGGNLTDSCPCPVCQELLKKYPVKAIYYFNKDMEVQQLNLEENN